MYDTLFSKIKKSGELKELCSDWRRSVSHITCAGHISTHSGICCACHISFWDTGVLCIYEFNPTTARTETIAPRRGMIGTNCVLIVCS